MQNTTPPGSGIADLLLLTTLLAIRQVPRAKFLGSGGLFCFISIWKFGSFKNPFAMITGLSELYFSESEDLSFWWTWKYWKPWRWVRVDLVFSMRDIYINSNLNRLTNFTSSGRSTEFKDILPWNISKMITKTIPIRTRTVISYAMKRGIPLWIWWKVNRDGHNNMIRVTQWRKSRCRTNTSIRRTN